MISSHIIAAHQIAIRRPIERVGEFGLGEVSTLTFLDRKLFPQLELLVSFENKLQWADEVGNLVAGDPRWLLRMAGSWEEMFNLIHGVPPLELVLVDSETISSRISILLNLAKMETQVPFILLHDSERGEYAPVVYNAYKFSYMFKYDYAPWTTVFSNVIDLKEFF